MKSPVNREKQTARLMYNKISRWYDLLAGSSEQEFMIYGISQLNPVPGEKIIEIGCGTGHGLIRLERSVTQAGEVIGLDISEGMLLQANALLNKSGYQKMIQVHQGDGCNLPYPSNYFSAAFLCFTLELFDPTEIPLVLKECRRVLSQKGRIVIVCLFRQNCLPVHIYEWFHKLLPAIIDCRPIFVQPYLLQASFMILDSKIKKMWGLPVEIVTAEIQK